MSPVARSVTDRKSILDEVMMNVMESAPAVLRNAGFDRQTMPTFYLLWRKFGKRKYLSKGGKRKIEKETKIMFVTLDRINDQRIEIENRIKSLEKDLETQGSDSVMGKTMLEALQNQLSEKTLEYNELEARFKFISLLGIIAGTREVLGTNLVRNVDSIMRDRKVSSRLREEIKDMNLNYGEAIRSLDKLSTTVETYAKETARTKAEVQV